MTMEKLIQSPEWLNLARHYDVLKAKPLSELVLQDANRLPNSTIAVDGLSLNYALHRVTPETVTLLAALAKACDLAGWQARMWGGEKINTSENRAALHVALRQTPATAEIQATRQRIAAFVGAVREGRFLGATGKRIRHVVNIGIGGSDLGPRLAARALSAFETEVQAHFVANADAFEITELFKRLDPAETLFVVVSKTFTTQETLLNAQTARQWVAAKLGEPAIRQHFVAVSTNAEAVTAFGIATDHMFPMWDWVGGRFSLWSAVGLAVELAIGTAPFEKLLQGAAAMDTHFRDAPFERNAPVMLAMLGIWARNFMGFQAHAVLPYSERLRDLPRYLQQLEMESNGKSVSRDGTPVEVKTAPVIFGDCGTIGQHSFHQWLHQGSDRVTADFIGIATDDLARPDHHQALLSNMAAQAGALAFGQAQAAAPQDVYVGNRPSTVIMLDRLDPYRLGLLLALYEHKIFTQSVIWNINPFDQPGVELGKRMARSLASGAKTDTPAAAFMATLYTQMTVHDARS